MLRRFALVLTFISSTFAQDFDRSVEQQMFELVNREREKRGIVKLEWDEKLQQAARKHTVELARNRKLLHQFPGEEPLQARLAATGLHFSASAENLASASVSEDLHMALMTSPGHRANILNPKYTAIGIGVIKGANSFYATQNFAKTTETVENGDAEQRMAATINKYRKGRGLPPVKFDESPRLRRVICDQAENERLSARALIIDSGYRGATAVTTSDLNNVPDALEDFASRSSLSRAAIAACFKVSPGYPGGVYWFAFEY